MTTPKPEKKKEERGYPCVKCGRIGYYKTGLCMSCRRKPCVKCKQKLPKNKNGNCKGCAGGKPGCQDSEGSSA